MAWAVPLPAHSQPADTAARHRVPVVGGPAGRSASGDEQRARLRSEARLLSLNNRVDMSPSWLAPLRLECAPCFAKLRRPSVNLARRAAAYSPSTLVLLLLGSAAACLCW